MSTSNACSVAGCDKPAAYTRLMCPMHRQRYRKFGTADPYPDQHCVVCDGVIADTGQRRTLCGARECYRTYMTSRARVHAATGRKRERTQERAAEDPYFQRARWLKSRYGITLGDYDRMLEMQDGACALCGVASSGRREFHVDHDPRCCPDDKGKTCGSCIRGLLCQRCNTGLGKFEDDPSLLRAAADYIARRMTQKESV